MMEQASNWFAQRSQREQAMLAIAGGLLLLAILVFGVILPGHSLTRSAGRELDMAIERRGRIEAGVALAKAKSPVVSAPPAAVAGASLDSLVGESASAGGFEIADGAMVGTDEFRFRLASVKAGALFNWLTALEAQRIELAQITLRKAEGGFVSADVRVRRKL
jgi:type II secretory pathway component PulM